MMPARSSPTMMASLWAPPTRASRVSGLSTASTKAGPGSRPNERASFGMQYAMSAMPATDCRRSSTTVISAWWKLSEADHPASIKKRGP